MMSAGVSPAFQNVCHGCRGLKTHVPVSERERVEMKERY
jgi:hypothetical protein